MKKIMNIFLMQAIIAFLFTAVATAQDYRVDPKMSQVVWKASKVVGGGHEGTINIKSGQLSMVKDLPSSGSVVIDMQTIKDTDLDGEMKEKLEGHLRSDDFFGIEKFPEAVFVLKKSATGTNGLVNVTGDLTIKGVTEPVSFSLAEVTRDKGNVIVKGTIEVDRSLYNVKYGSGKFFENLGDRAINDIFTLDFKLYLVN